MLELGNNTSEDSIAESVPKTLEELCARIEGYFPGADLAFIRKAYEFSEKAHSGQIRRSGEPYISHPLGVAAILSGLHLDLATIATGLLHDTVEDTQATLADIEREFGKPVAELVDGVTKISKISFRNTHEKQGENIRKMIIAMGKDVRVVLVKLADRLHNMRSLNHMPPDKQQRIAQETLDIYAPLAGRLGIMSLKIELEDLSFRYSKPDSYYQLAQKVAVKKKDRERYIEETKRVLIQDLTSRTKLKFEVYGRPKHLFSIYKKMQHRSLDYDQIYDVLAFRVVVGSISECYEVLGNVHALWKPIPGRFKDFIAMPKVNNYQSLHTTVIGPGGERIEIQIRTRDMHLVAERGIAAHWKYKEGGKLQDGDQKFSWLRDLVSLHQQVRNPDEFLETVKTDLFEREIYVFTPRGDVRELPDGATVIDFAYAVHTDVGSKCTSARVNGKMVPLKTELKSGDTIEIITSVNQHPSKDWLKMCVTTRAKSKIRSFLQNEQRARALEMGREMLDKDFRKIGKGLQNILKTYKDSPELAPILQSYGVSTFDDLFVQVGYGKTVGRDIVEKFFPGVPETPVEAIERKTSFMQKVVQGAAKKLKKSKSIIRVDGMDDMLVRFGKCCDPIPGDPIAGFITRGRGITVHKADCERAFENDNDRRIDVAWTVKTAPDGVERVVRVRVVSHDTPGLLRSMTEAFSTHGINIHNAQIRTTKDRTAICLFDVSVKDTDQLSKVMQDLQKIPGITGVTRVTHV
jgi:guanosine-3',5'-bis(diphosphate) 3'-pyrophosphohydrolase